MYVTNCDVAVIVPARPDGSCCSGKKEPSASSSSKETDHGRHPQQCITPVRVDYFNEELTGPEYAERFPTKRRLWRRNHLEFHGAEILPEEHEVIFVTPPRSPPRRKPLSCPWCREEPHNILIPGSRPAGVYTPAPPNSDQQTNAMVGKRVVILGSGDIGIMARRMTLEAQSHRRCKSWIFSQV